MDANYLPRYNVKMVDEIYNRKLNQAVFNFELVNWRNFVEAIIIKNQKILSADDLINLVAMIINFTNSMNKITFSRSELNLIFYDFFKSDFLVSLYKKEILGEIKNGN